LAGYLVRRVALTGVVVVLVTLIIFVLMRWLPGDPVALMYPDVTDPPTLARMRHDLGLDQPLVVQYVQWLGQLARGDLGTSPLTRQRVGDTLLQRLPVTLELGAVALVLSWLIAVPLGVISATRPGTAVAAVARVVALLGISAPSFFLAFVLIYLFAIILRWVPPSGYTNPAQSPLLSLRSLLLPGLTLGAAMGAVTMRMLRASLLEVLNLDYVRVARAKGLGEQLVVRRHALRNALIPVITVVGLEMGALLGGAVIVETVFSIPGLGSLLVNSLLGKDYLMVQGTVLLLACGFSVLNLLIDLTYSVVDPRIRYGS
jgi:peptide/nickel transport system permease protein